MAKLDLEFHFPEGITLDMDGLTSTLLMETIGTTVMGDEKSLSVDGMFNPDEVRARITQLLEGSGITFTEK